MQVGEHEAVHMHEISEGYNVLLLSQPLLILALLILNQYWCFVDYNFLNNNLQLLVVVPAGISLGASLEECNHCHDVPHHRLQPVLQFNEVNVVILLQYFQQPIVIISTIPFVLVLAGAYDVLHHNLGQQSVDLLDFPKILKMADYAVHIFPTHELLQQPFALTPLNETELGVVHLGDVLLKFMQLLS